MDDGANTMSPEITPFDWHRILFGDPPVTFMLEIVLRVVLIYVFAVAFLHVLGKRGQKQLTPLEYMVIIALGSATGDSMLYPDVPVLHAAVVVVALMAVTELISQLKLRVPQIGSYIDTHPTTIVEHGHLVDENVRAERLSDAEVVGMLRERGVRNIGDIEYAFLEVSGAMSVFEYPESEKRHGRSIVPPERTRYSRLGRHGRSRENAHQ
jgi:uncharacterized membrane protein YcaP (DUF421 family)